MKTEERIVQDYTRTTLHVGDRVRRFAMIKRDGPRHSGTIKEIKLPVNSSPVIVVKMDDGSIEHWNTKWTSEGPWDLDAPFVTKSGRSI